MKHLVFPNEIYDYIDKEVNGKRYNGFRYQKTEESNIGLVEFIWVALNQAIIDNISKHDLKTLRRLKKKFKEITRFKDEDKDARISIEGSQSVVLEGDEYIILRRILEKITENVALQYSDDLDTIWTIFDSAPDYHPPKPEMEK